MLNTVNSYTGFEPLKRIWLGDCYPVEFYSHLSPEIQDAFALITEWTQKDLKKIQSTLESLGVVVDRPEFHTVDDCIVNDILLKPPICPRDTTMALGKDLYHLRSRWKRDPWQKTMDLMSPETKIIKPTVDHPLDCLDPPSIVRVGRDLYIDYDTHKHVWPFIAEILVEWAREYRVHVCHTGGHSDGVFCPVKPGVIVASHWLTQYENTFPGWRVYHIPGGPNVNGHNGRWYIPQANHITNTRSFVNHIDQFAQDWVGNVHETVFETNMLVVNPHHVLAIAENDKLFRWLETQGVTVTLCDFRCRGFWDGGLHCLTVDVVREGGAADYFPDRPDQPYLDWL